MSLRKFTTKTVLLGSLIVSLIGLSALAQQAPQSGSAIGPATSGPSKTLIDGALTPETRQTLQDAMNSVDTPVTATTPANPHVLMIGPGEGAELDGSKVTKVDYAKLPASLRAALVHWDH